MPLSITSVARTNGAACDHITVTVNHEGTTRTWQTSFGAVDTLLNQMTPIEQLRLLVTLWAKYRRANGRSVEGVTIA